MNITKSKLKQLIREELENVLNEKDPPGHSYDFPTLRERQFARLKKMVASAFIRTQKILRLNSEMAEGHVLAEDLRLLSNTLATIKGALRKGLEYIPKDFKDLT
jgi:hypothetical protein